MSLEQASRMLSEATIVARLLVLILIAGCRTVPAPPTTIIVAAKDQQLRWDSRVVGVQTVPIDRSRDRVREVRQEQIVREYWVKSSDGDWYRISKADWDAARVGDPLEIHPTPLERSPVPSAGFPCSGPDGLWRC